MYQFILLIHVFAAIFIVALVLVQQGKGAALGAAFGSGASQTLFGSRGSGSFLFKLTLSLAIIFFITSLSLNYIATQAFKQEKSITLPIDLHKASNVPVKDIPVDNIPGRTSAPVDNHTAQGLPSEIPVRK